MNAHQRRLVIRTRGRALKPFAPGRAVSLKSVNGDAPTPAVIRKIDLTRRQDPIGIDAEGSKRMRWVAPERVLLAA